MVILNKVCKQKDAQQIAIAFGDKVFAMKP